MPTPEQIAKRKRQLESLENEIEELKREASDLEDKIWDAENPERAKEMGRRDWEDEE